MNGRLKRTLALLVLALPLAAAGKETLIRNATVLTVSHGALAHSDVLIRDGRIAAVGSGLKAAQGAQVIDATDRYLMPGIIDAHSHIAVEGVVNEMSLAVTSMAAIGSVLNPDDPGIFFDLAGGVTSANVLHGSANAIGGQNAVIKLRWGKDAEGLRFEGAPPGIKFALGENPKHTNFPASPAFPPRYPATRMGVMDVIRQAFVDAREYRKAWDEFRRKSSSDKKAVAPARDLRLEPLVEVLEGKRLVHAHCYRADEIVQLLRLAEEFGFRIATLQHVLEGYKVAPEIAKHGAGASTFSDWWGYKVEAFDATPYNAAAMARAGVLVSINSDDTEQARHLNHEAAKTIRYGGLSEDEALALITLNPAKQLGISARVGSIEVGKDADLVLYDRHPLSVYAVPQQVFIDGEVYFDRAKDLAERPKREKERQELLARQKARAAKGGDSRPTKPAEFTSGSEFPDDQASHSDFDKH